MFFSFADPVGFSGQKSATVLIINGLSARGWVCRRLPLPAFKDNGNATRPIQFAACLLAAWFRAIRLLFARGGWLFVTFGQTRFTFIRDAVPLLLGWAALGRDRVFILLNGSLFMRWSQGSFNARAFTFLLRKAGTVTVTGESQKDRLVELGISGSRVEIVINSCDAEVLAPEDVRAKHDRNACADRPLRLLFLSSLIDTKGYPEYLEAVRRLSSWGGPNVEAVVCGRVSSSEFSQRFKDSKAAEGWIEEQIAAINLSPRVRARWVKGAWGVEKAALFREADIFVLPTRYAVEAQPVTLLEAMASGCAIVTTRAGEIQTILSDDCAVFLEMVSTDAVEKALQNLSLNPGKRLQIATTAHQRFTERFGKDRHIDHWERLLDRTRPMERDAT